MAKAHLFETIVKNVRDGETAVAIATDWLRDELSEVDLASVDTFEEDVGVRVQFCARLDDEQLEVIHDSETFVYVGTTR